MTDESSSHLPYPGNRPNPDAQWTLESLKFYLEQRLEEMQDNLSRRDDATATALQAAKASADVAISAAAAVQDERRATTASTLLQHIQAQEKSVAAALESLDKRLAEWDKGLEARDIAERRERDEIFNGVRQTLTALIDNNRQRQDDALKCLEGILHEREKAVATLKQEQAESVRKAEDALDKRLFSMNQFRDQIREERGEYVRRDFYQERHTDLERRVEAGLAALEKPIDDGKEERNRLREQILGLSTRQVYQRESVGETRDRVGLYLTGIGVFISATLAVLALILHFAGH